MNFCKGGSWDPDRGHVEPVHEQNWTIAVLTVLSLLPHE